MPPTARSDRRPQGRLLATLGDLKLAGNVRAAALKALPLTGADHAKTNFAILATALREGQERSAAARAIMQLPRDSWNPTAAAPLTASILNWAQSVPAADRTKQDFVETVQAGVELASLLPPTEAATARKELRSLGVSVFVIKTVREQMRYDTPRLVVEAGKAFEVIIENVDLMPHNIVFVEPGTRQAVAEAAQTMKPDQLDKEGRSYVPQKDKRVLDASKMLEAGQKQTMKMKAPQKEGEYEYVCTFPGHWTIMWGKMIVTKDVEGYLQAHPQAANTPVSPATEHRVHEQIANTK